jgi:hypothetical protein
MAAPLAGAGTAEKMAATPGRPLRFSRHFLEIGHRRSAPDLSETSFPSQR